MDTMPRRGRAGRKRELVQATRRLFDERRIQDAPIEQIAQAVGIARGLIYREFSSKDELYVLTVTDYLEELARNMSEAIPATAPPEEQLERCADAFAGYCLRYPAFLDCALSIMRQPARELQESVSGDVWLALGRGIASCSGQLAQILRNGNATGDFAIEDPDLITNFIWTQTLGAMHLARIGVGIRAAAPGVPELFTVEPDVVVRQCVASAMAMIRA